MPTPETPQAETPRTDGFEIVLSGESPILGNRYRAWADFARQLERQLAEARDALTAQVLFSAVGSRLMTRIFAAADMTLEDSSDVELQLVRLLDELVRLRSQLPEGMPDCTILFKECPVGHGRLTATNWIDHGCPTCERNSLRSQLAALHAASPRETIRLQTEVLQLSHQLSVMTAKFNQADAELGQAKAEVAKLTEVDFKNAAHIDKLQIERDEAQGDAIVKGAACATLRERAEKWEKTATLLQLAGATEPLLAELAALHAASPQPAGEDARGEPTDTQMLEWLLSTGATVSKIPNGTFELYERGRGLPTSAAYSARQAIAIAMRPTSPEDGK